jgi:hypothetical protein
MPGPITFTIESRTRRLMSPEEAEYYVGGESILERMVAAGWIKPSINQKKMKRYDLKKLDHCIDRLGDEELP